MDYDNIALFALFVLVQFPVLMQNGVHIYSAS